MAQGKTNTDDDIALEDLESMTDEVTADELVTDSKPPTVKKILMGYDEDEEELDWETVNMDEAEDIQDLSDLITNCSRGDIMKIAMCEYQPSDVYGVTWCQFRNITPSKELMGKSISILRSHANRIINNFSPSTDGGLAQTMRNGGFERSSEDPAVYVKRAKGPSFSWTAVSTESSEKARLAYIATKPVFAPTYDPTKQAVEQISAVVPANTMKKFPINPALKALAGNLRVKAGTNFFYVWDLAANLICGRKDKITGMCHLFYVYRAVPVKTPNPHPDLKPFAHYFKDIGPLDVDKGHFRGYFNGSVWLAGAPVSSDQVAASFLERYLKGVALRGPFSSSLVSWLSGRVLYSESARQPELASKVRVEIKSQAQVLEMSDGLYWSPPPKSVHTLKADSIALSITTISSTVDIAVSWMARYSESRWDLAVTFGPNPILWVVKTSAPASLAFKQAIGYLPKLCNAPNWITLYNFNCMLAEQDDVWAIVIREGRMVVERIGTMALYKHCPYQMAMKDLLGPVAWETPEFELDFVDDGADSYQDYRVDSPCYQPSKKPKLDKNESSEEAAVDDSSHDGEIMEDDPEALVPQGNVKFAEF